MSNNKEYRIITADRLIKCLGTIEWGVSWRGCDVWAIENHKGELTRFTYRMDTQDDKEDTIINSLEVGYFSGVFGESSHTGSFNVKLDDASIELDGKAIYIKGTDYTISFYNFDKEQDEDDD